MLDFFSSGPPFQCSCCVGPPKVFNEGILYHTHDAAQPPLVFRYRNARSMASGNHKATLQVILSEAKNLILWHAWRAVREPPLQIATQKDALAMTTKGR